MQIATYIIDYTIYDRDNIVVKEGQIKVHNKASSFEAQCSLENYLRKKYRHFHKMTVSSCKAYTHQGINDFLNMFH